VVLRAQDHGRQMRASVETAAADVLLHHLGERHAADDGLAASEEDERKGQNKFCKLLRSWTFPSALLRRRRHYSGALQPPS